MNLIVPVLLVVATCTLPAVPAYDDILDQQLILACYKLETDNVVAALRKGANANGRFGQGDVTVFQNPWSLGQPVAAKAWTPLLALANANAFPDPPRRVENTVEDLKWAAREKSNVADTSLAERRAASKTILMILLSHKSELDGDDGFGSTALYDAINNRNERMASVLIQFGATVRTKTRTYIDGPGEVTPLHAACWSPKLTKKLLELGADPNAKDTNGDTPLDWAKRQGDIRVVQLYEPLHK